MADGRRIIDSALSIFTRVMIQLNRGIDACSKRMNENSSMIGILDADNTELESYIKKANTVMVNLEKLTLKE